AGEGREGVRPKIIGARVKRVEDPRLLTGAGTFADDRVAPNALHVAFRRSDHAHARIVRIDCAAERSMPGVAGVFTVADLDGLTKPILATSRMKNYHATEIPLLARGKVRYVGEPVVAVLADNRYLAEDALEHIEIEFAPLDDVVDPEAALRPGAPLLHQEAGANILVEREFSRGEVDAAMASAAVRVGGRFRMHRRTPTAMENRAYLAEYDRGRNTLTLTSSTQVPGIVRDALVEFLGMPGHSVRVVAEDVGGGFGGKASL